MCVGVVDAKGGPYVLRLALVPSKGSQKVTAAYYRSPLGLLLHVTSVFPSLGRTDPLLMFTRASQVVSGRLW